jgi:hypothetical protein
MWVINSKAERNALKVNSIVPPNEIPLETTKERWNKHPVVIMAK